MREDCRRIVRIAVILGFCAYGGCATPEREHVLPNRDATIGMTKEALLQCAGQPIREEAQNHSVLFLYYNEAPMLSTTVKPSLKPVILSDHLLVLSNHPIR